MQHFNIEAENLEFKNLLSGPAPIGRILNYVYLIGTTGLYHKNGYRYTSLENSIGYAWTTEFMIGLGLLSLGTAVNDRFQLVLTKNGMILFNLMKDTYQQFSEGVRSNEITAVRNEINVCNPRLYDEFKRVFVESFPFKILKEFLNENGYIYNDRKTFMDDLFETVKMAYDTDPTPYNRDARIPTAGNRVPSLLQLLELFDMLMYDGTQLSFIKRSINAAFSNEDPAPISKDILVENAEQENIIIKEAQELVDKYGEDGTVVLESIVRNSTLQKMFKHNLMISQNKQCIMCGIKNPDLLIGSHIKPAVKSTVEEKVDYNNGLLLCCNHDKLFDHYLITFNFLDGQIEISKSLSDEDRLMLGLDENFKLDESLLTEKRQDYLMQHNLEFKDREENR